MWRSNTRRCTVTATYFSGPRPSTGFQLRKELIQGLFEVLPPNFSAPPLRDPPFVANPTYSERRKSGLLALGCLFRTTFLKIQLYAKHAKHVKHVKHAKCKTHMNEKRSMQNMQKMQKCKNAKSHAKHAKNQCLA